MTTAPSDDALASDGTRPDRVLLESSRARLRELQLSSLPVDVGVVTRGREASEMVTPVQPRRSSAKLGPAGESNGR